jgi:hypothetical protein
MEQSICHFIKHSYYCTHSDICYLVQDVNGKDATNLYYIFILINLNYHFFSSNDTTFHVILIQFRVVYNVKNHSHVENTIASKDVIQ